jgi:Vitamin K-dependent gamma-carboxylase
MSAPLGRPVSPSPSLVARVARTWEGFWFSPADPTPLGVMRISCGLIALYVHLIYGIHLQDLFGENAWIDLRAINEMRAETPTVAPPTDWQDSEPLDVTDLDPKARSQIWAYHDKWGVDPRRTLAKGEYGWSIWFHVTDPAWMVVVHNLYLGVLILFTLGFYTRITSALAWLGALSYVHRAPTTLFGMDSILMIMLMYLTLGPSGKALSLDRILENFRACRRALSLGRPAPRLSLPQPMVSANFTLRLFQLHLCIIYLSAGLAKMPGGHWWNGTAVWRPIATYEYAPLNLALYADSLRFISAHRWAWEMVMTGGTLLTLFVEIGFPFLVWSRKMRWVMLGAAALLHLGIGLFMGLLVFSLCMLTMLISFVPAEAIHFLAKKLLRGSARSRLLYQRSARGQVRAASAVHALDTGEQVEVEEYEYATLSEAAVSSSGNDPSATTVSSATPSGGTSEGPRRLRVVTASSIQLTGYPLYEHLVRSLPLLWPLAALTWVPGVGWAGRRLSPCVSGTTATKKRPQQTEILVATKV